MPVRSPRFSGEMVPSESEADEGAVLNFGMAGQCPAIFFWYILVITGACAMAKTASKTAAKAGKKGAKTVAAKRAPTKPAKPTLLSGGNPQIAKCCGDEPVQAYIAAMPGWKSDVGRKLDALIGRAVPGVAKAVKWNSPFYGVQEGLWFLSFHVFAKYIKVAFFRGHLARSRTAWHLEAEGGALSRHLRGRLRRGAIRELGEAGQRIAGREDVKRSRV
jgi:hypothetical protein